MVILSHAATISSDEIQRVIDATAPGGEVRLPEGRIVGELVVSKPLTLRGTGRTLTLIDGCGVGRALRVEGGGRVILRAFTVTGGQSECGGGIAMTGAGELHVVDCRVVANTAKVGGGLHAERGRVLTVRTDFVANDAEIGGAMFVGGDARVRVQHGRISDNRAARGAGVAAEERARVWIFATEFGLNHARDTGHHLFVAAMLETNPIVSLTSVTMPVVPGQGKGIARSGPAAPVIKYEARP